MDFFEAIEMTTGLWVYIAFVYVVDWIWDVAWFWYVDWSIERLDTMIADETAQRGMARLKAAENEIARQHQDRLGVYICQSPWS